MLDLAKGLVRGLEAVGYQVQLLDASIGASSFNIPMSVYDLVCIGSPAVGTFGGEISADIDAALRKAMRLQGRPSVAFVRAKAFGANRSLRVLMEAMEAQGAWVQDFAALSTPAEAERFGRKLEKLQRL